MPQNIFDAAFSSQMASVEWVKPCTLTFCASRLSVTLPDYP